MLRLQPLFVGLVGDLLNPCFLCLSFSFPRSYAEAGLIRASYDVSFILALPIIGMAADRFKATSIILVGLLLYTLIGASYFLAGVTGMVCLLCWVVFKWYYFCYGFCW